MKKQFKNCSATRLLSILLFADVSIGAGISVYQGEVLWALSFIGALISGVIALTAVMNSDDDDNQNHNES